MARRISLNQAVSPNQTATERDLGQVRWALSHLGLFDPAREDRMRTLGSGMSSGLRRAVRVFQAGQGLREDAQLKPRGPTEARLNQLLADDRGLRIGDGPEREPGALAGRIGPGLENHPDDLTAVGGALRGLGHIKPGAPNPPRPGSVFDGLKSFQRAAGLSRDGIMVPGGPSERELLRQRESSTQSDGSQSAEAARLQGDPAAFVSRRSQPRRDGASQTLGLEPFDLFEARPGRPDAVRLRRQSDDDRSTQPPEPLNETNRPRPTATAATGLAASKEAVRIRTSLGRALPGAPETGLDAVEALHTTSATDQRAVARLGQGLLDAFDRIDRGEGVDPSVFPTEVREDLEAYATAEPEGREAYQDFYTSLAAHVPLEEDDAVAAAEGVIARSAFEGTDALRVRRLYQKEISEASKDYMKQFRTGGLPARDAALAANLERKKIMARARKNGTLLAKNIAESKKEKSRSFSEMQERKAQEFFDKPFAQLDEREKVKAWIGIIESSGKDQADATREAKIAGRVGKGLWVLSAGIAAYEILTAEDKPRAALEQAGSVGGGFLGGAGGGALVGAAVGAFGGPAAPVTVGLGVLLGSIAGAVFGEKVMNEVADQIFGPEE